MASIYKRNGTKVWQASYFVPSTDGGPPKQIRKSTGKRNERDAKNAAAEMEREDLKKAGITDERGRQIQAILVRAGEDAVRMTLNATKARAYMTEILKISTGEDMPQFTIRNWTNEWLARKLPSVADSTRKRYKCNTKAFIDWLGERADRPLESVTVTDVRKFHDHLILEGRSERTCQFYLSDVGSVFRAAVREGILLHNPVSATISKTSEPEVKKEPFTHDEVSQLLKHAPTEEWRGLILIGAFTGLRLKDAATLAWENIDLAKGTITLTPGKTARKKRMLTVPMHPQVRKFLAELQPANTSAGPIFSNSAEKGIGGRSGLSRTFRSIMDEASVSANPTKPTAEEEQGTKRRHRVAQRSFHSLRHTFTSWLANADVSPELRMKLTGHTTADVHAGYTHHELATLSDAVTKLPKLSAGM